VNTAPDRRGEPRFSSIDDHAIVAARIRAGADLCVIDASAGGALVETTQRLRPNGSVDLQLSTADTQVVARGRVTRCQVSRLSATIVWYRGAIAFDRALPWIASPGRTDAALPGAELRPPSCERGPATHERQ
jgi:hypothetical protein